MSNNQSQPLKGFRDFIGIEARKREWLVWSISNTFKRFGFEPMGSPALEYESLLLGKYGDEAEKLIYRFEDNGGRKVALRYDQTVPTARIIARFQNEITFPYRRYQIQPVWRADKPQRGRYRELIQCDADIVGIDSEIADAEILAVYYAIYADIGIPSLVLQFNDRKQLITTIKEAGVDDSKINTAIQTIDKLDKKSRSEVV